MDIKTISKYLKSLGKVTEEDLVDERAVLFKTNDRLFAVLELGNNLKISLRCESELADVLRNKYETVMPGQKLNSKNWNTILLTGQIDWPEIKSFIDHAYLLVSQ